MRGSLPAFYCLVIPVTLKSGTLVSTLPGVLESLLGLVDPVSVERDWVR